MFLIGFATILSGQETQPPPPPQEMSVQEMPDYNALPPPIDDTGTRLETRVTELEKQLAGYANKEAEAKQKNASKPVIAPSGRIQLDAANFTQNSTSVSQYGNARNAIGFRRARLAIFGEYEQFDYIVEMDFANRGVNSEINSKDQSTAFKDVFIQMHDLPTIGNVRVGHFKEGFGLEQMTSDNYTTFMERSLLDEGAFVPGRNDGIQMFSWTENQRATWSLGVFANQTGYDQPPLFQYDHWGLAATMRGTFLPYYDEPSNGRRLFHTGLDYSYRSAPDNTAIYATRPESAFAPSVINMTLTNVYDWQVFGVEAAVVDGPLSLQSEAYGMTVDRQNGESNNFFGVYGFVSYFLTGENRPYNRKLGVFDRVKPKQNFFRKRNEDGDIQTGCGAWEVAYRFSYVNMLDNLTTKGAGMAMDHTLGINWYFNPFTRVMFNYVHSTDTYNVAAGQRLTGGNIDVFEARFAMDF